MTNDLHVLVIGGGIGGLCLAQGLKKAGIAVDAYERDLSSSSRLQGVRIHIDPDGSTALHECLPGNLWEIFDSTGGDFSRGFTMLNEKLEVLMNFHQPPAMNDQIARHRSVSRNSLRQILLAGLGDVVHFDKRFEHYERRADGCIVAFFEDGTTAEGNVLVAADGVNSRVRQQYLPGNDPIDTGTISLGGRIPLTDGVMAMIPPCLLDGPAMVLPPAPANLFMAAWKRSAEASDRVRALTGSAAGADTTGEDGSGYLVLALGARREFFALTSEPETMTTEEKRAVLRSKMLDWHPNLRKLVEMTGDDLGFLRIRTSQPVAPWTPTTVTLLGDAIHNMTPYRGIGANVALRDAALLCAKLLEAQSSGASPAGKIGEYEAEMRRYGFAAVAASRKSLEQAVSPKRLGFKLAMAAMRTAQRIPALRRRILEERVTRPSKTLAQAS